MAIFAIAIVIAVAMAAVAYAAPKLYWYWAQVKLLNRAQDDSAKLVDLHVADRTPEPGGLKITTAGVGDGQYL